MNTLLKSTKKLTNSLSLILARQTKISTQLHIRWNSSQIVTVGHRKVTFSYLFNNPCQIFRNHIPRPRQAFTTSCRGVAGRAEEEKKLIEQPPRKKSNDTASVAVATSALIGLGALCCYGSHISDDSTIPNVEMWRDSVRDRLKSTYAYFGASMILTGGASLLASKSRVLMRLMGANAFAVLGTSLVCQILSGIVVIHSNYSPGFGFKQMAWIVHSSIMGLSIAPMCFIAGPWLIKAFSLTAGLIGGLSVVAYCAPEGQFLSWSSPLALVLGGVFAAAFSSFLLPHSARIGTGLTAVYLYGGLVIFSLMLLYDSEQIIKQAERTPHDDPYGFDPINSAMSLYMNSLNVFVRFVQIFALQEVKKRKDK